MNREERIDRARGRKYFSGWRPPAPGEEEPEPEPSPTIGHNGAPRYDPDAPVTGFPYVMRDAAPVVLDGKNELTSRSQIRDFEREHGVERSGFDWNGEEKPEWWDEHIDNRREREKAAKQGKQGPERFLPRKKGDTGRRRIATAE